MRKFIEICITLVLFFGCVSIPSETTAPPTSPTTTDAATATPAQFEITDLRVAPEKLHSGDTVTILVDIQNRGDASESYAVVVTIGNDSKTQEIVLEGKSCKTVEFQHTVDAEGLVEIKAGKLAKTIYVTLSSTLPPTTMTSPDPVIFQDPQQYRVTYVVTVHNEGFTIDDLRVYQPCPIEWDSQKDIDIEEVSPSSTKKGTDPVFGNGIYYWQRVNEPKTGESTSFTLRFTFTAYETITTIDPEKIQPYRHDNAYALYTCSERFIEAADPEIIAAADQVAEGETNPYFMARKFYDYVIDTTTYERLGQGLFGAKRLLTIGKGECGDYSALFVALCRAKGIPARPVVGYWAISGIEQTHVWAEFYLEPFGWIPVDPTVAQGQPEMRDYYFGNMDNHRVILNKGYNVPLEPPAPDNYLVPFLQVPLWWFWGDGDVSALSIERTQWIVMNIPLE